MSNTSHTSRGERPIEGSSNNMKSWPCHQCSADGQHLLLTTREIACRSRTFLQAREVTIDHVDIALDRMILPRVCAEQKVLAACQVADDTATFHHLNDTTPHDRVGWRGFDALAAPANVAARDGTVLVS